MIYNTIPCLVCGEDVHNVPTNCVICDKCKSVILKMRRKEEYNVPKTYMVRFIDESGNISYVTRSPKMVTPNSIESKIKVLKEDAVANLYHFSPDKEKAQFFTRTQANKLGKSFYLLQQNGYYKQFVSVEIVKDNEVTFHWDFEKGGM